MLISLRPSLRRVFLLLILLGVLLGLGFYTFYFAQGLSYLSNDPKVCVNCHVMQEQYDGWQKSSHHAVATCNDCHAPHNAIGKYLTKAENGFRHSMAFTLQNFHEPIQIRKKNAEILNGTCLYCHGDFVGNTLNHGVSDLKNMPCTKCHSSVGHGVK